MSKTKSTKKATKAAKPAIEIRKDAKGRFWVVPKDGGVEQGPFTTKKEAMDAKTVVVGGAPALAATAEQPATTKTKSKKTKPPKEKKLSAIDAAAQVLADSKEPMNAKEMIEAMTAKALWTSPG